MQADERPGWLVDLALALMAEPDLRLEDPMLVRAIVEHSPCEWAQVSADRGESSVVVAQATKGTAIPAEVPVRDAGAFSDGPVVDRAAGWAILRLGAIGTLAIDVAPLGEPDLRALVSVAEHFTRRVLSSNLLESIVENLPDMVFVKDADELRFVRFNRAGEGLLGFSREEMLGRNDYDFFPAAEADFFTAKDRAVLVSGDVLDIPEEPIHTATGTRILHTKKIPIKGSDGQPRYLLGISRDITDRKLIEERLIQSQKLEGIANLTAGLAHNFNNAAMVISGYAALTARSLEGADSQAARFLTKLRRASSRVSDLADRLLGFARTRIVHRIETDIGVLFAETAHMLERVISEVVVVDASDIRTGCYARVDRAQLEQVLVNLAVNARDAMTGGGRLVIGVRRVRDETSDAIEITVADSGHGMSDEVRRRAFEPFFTTKTDGAGSGLGLFSVFEIVRHHDGHIEIDSAPGGGTTVTIRLPAVEAPTTSPRINPHAGFSAGETILLVEDDADVREVLTANLEAFGYGVLSASDGVDALALANDLGTEPIDLLLSDVVMPRMGGPELAKRMREARPTLRTILVSGYTNEAATLAVDPSIVFLAKPVETDRLMAAIRDLLDS